VHKTGPWEPEENGGRELLQLITAVDSKEQEILDTVLSRVEEIHTAAMIQQSDRLSFIPDLSKLYADERVSLCHNEKLTMLWEFCVLNQGERKLFLLLSDIRELIRSFHQDRESLQDSSGVEVFFECCRGNGKEAKAGSGRGG
jgi:hypothetical protein